MISDEITLFMPATDVHSIRILPSSKYVCRPKICVNGKTLLLLLVINNVRDHRLYNGIVTSEK